MLARRLSYCTEGGRKIIRVNLPAISPTSVAAPTFGRAHGIVSRYQDCRSQSDMTCPPVVSPQGSAASSQYRSTWPARLRIQRPPLLCGQLEAQSRQSNYRPGPSITVAISVNQRRRRHFDRFSAVSFFMWAMTRACATCSSRRSARCMSGTSG